MEIRTGHWENGRQTKIHDIEKIIWHPDFYSSLLDKSQDVHDIALIKVHDNQINIFSHNLLPKNFSVKNPLEF